jgi:hypothetical protein
LRVKNIAPGHATDGADAKIKKLGTVCIAVNHLPCMYRPGHRDIAVSHVLHAIDGITNEKRKRKTYAVLSDLRISNS